MLVQRKKRDVKKERKISPKRALKYTHFARAGKSSYEDERRSLRHHHMMISDAEGLILIFIIAEVSVLIMMIHVHLMPTFSN